MRNRVLFPVLALVGITSFQSCTKVTNALQYDIPLQSGNINISIPPSTVTAGNILGTATNTINVDSVIKASTGKLLGINDITSVTIKYVNVAILNVTTANSLANF